MLNQVEFFFDFMSPYAYLAHQRLPNMAYSFNYEIVYKPIELPRAKLAAGNTGPANRKIPVKLSHLMKDLQRWAERYGVPFSFPKSLDSEKMNIGTFYAMQQFKTCSYVAEGYRLTWGSGGDMGDESILRELATTMKWDGDAFLEFIASDAAREQYEQCNLEAHRRGIFGVPTMVVDDEMWWGNDRLMFVEEYIEAHSSR